MTSQYDQLRFDAQVGKNVFGHHLTWRSPGRNRLGSQVRNWRRRLESRPMQWQWETCLGARLA